MLQSWWWFHALAPLQLRPSCFLGHDFAFFKQGFQCLSLQTLLLAFRPLLLFPFSFFLQCLLPFFGFLFLFFAFLVEQCDTFAFTLFLGILPCLSFCATFLLPL
jgi:hypothetical protein